MFAILSMVLSYIFKPHLYPNYRPTCIIRSAIVYSGEGGSTMLDSLNPPSGGELKLLTNINCNAWAQNWLIHMGRNDTELYDEHYCTECLHMKESSNIYTAEEYFYFGFFPEGSKCGSYEPKYMALFFLDAKRRAMNAKLIVENPKFIEEDTMLLTFENDVRKLCDESYVFFKYDELKRPGQIRYYYEWTFTN